MLKASFKKYFCPGALVTVDERTIPIRNRKCSIRVYNPKKPYKFGIEVFTLCDSNTYYCYDFLVYDKVPQQSMTANIVLDLARSLPKDLKFTITLDRGFTSPILLYELRKLGHGATCTMLN